MALNALGLELLDGNDEAGAGAAGGEGLVVNPAFEDVAEAALAEEAVGAEVASGILEITEGEGFEVAFLTQQHAAAAYHS